MSQRTVAITGASGFIGRHLIRAFTRKNWNVRVLARRPGALKDIDAPISVIEGDLENETALRDLARSADCVVHTAGLVSATNPDDFERINVAGTERLAKVARSDAPECHFVHFSSLAARQPEISRYANSKHESETVVARQSAGRASIIRPPAVYGPGDRATLPLFEQMAKGFLVTPDSDTSRFSLIHARDLAELTERICDARHVSAQPIEPDDGMTGGYGWSDLVRLATDAFNRRIRRIALPRVVYRGIATVAGVISLINGKPPLISHDKVAELFHEDWVCRGFRELEPPGGPIGLVDGFRQTLGWYRDHGWIRA
jgi:nucleoside-diphosphate-sugar epimerase